MAIVKIIKIVKSLLNTKAPTRPTRVIVHHLGKAGEGFLATPMARTLRHAYPNAHIEWVVLDRYRAFIGENKYIDTVTEIDSSKARSLKDIGEIITKYHKKTIAYRPVDIVDGTWHCNAYCNYIVKTKGKSAQLPQEIPFYRQFFKNMPFQNHKWAPPMWTARAQDIEDGERFLKDNGIGENSKVIVVSPFVSDKTIPLDSSALEVDWDFLISKVNSLGLPIIITGTEFDEKWLPEGSIDGYAPKLSLGGLFYILQTRGHLIICGNTGIGFAALFLKVNLLMYENRKSWTEHTHNYANEELHREGDIWPMFDTANMKADLPDWESNFIHHRWNRETVEDDVDSFRITAKPGLEVKSRNTYPGSLYSTAEHLLRVGGHKYQKLHTLKPSCRVSVLVSLYNAKKYVTARLTNLLEQSEKDIEVIVIDAASPQEDGKAVLEQFGDDPRVIVITLNERIPLYSAWNIGLTFSSGKYIANANADDLLAPTTLEDMADWLDANPEADLLAGSWYEVKEENNLWPPPEGAEISTIKAPGHFPLWRRDLHVELGLFDDTFKIVGDIDWWIRLLLNQKKIFKAPQPMGAYLNHGENLFIKHEQRRAQESRSSGWPHYLNVLYEETFDAELPQSTHEAQTPKSAKEGDDLSGFRDRHLGERCFIMGNGPSLNKMDLSKLEGETVFASNGIYLLFDRISWRPKYYSCVDSRVLPDISEDIIAMHEENPEMTLFLPDRLHLHDGSRKILDTRDFVPGAEKRYYFNHIYYNEDQLPWSTFSADINDHVVMPHTVSITLLQLALYMGFKEIYLIGCDTSYKVPESVIHEGPTRDDYGSMLLTSTEDDDPNHFDPRYFGAGKHWHNPKVGEMIRHYEFAKMAIDSRGATVYNATVGGELEVFERVGFDDLFKKKK